LSRLGLICVGAGEKKVISGTFRVTKRECSNSTVEEDSTKEFKQWPEEEAVGAISSSIISNAIWSRCFSSGDQPPEGLIIFSGSTDCAKSSIARALVKKSIGELVEKNKGPGSKARLPHLITFEDPIEDWKFDLPKDESTGKQEPIELDHKSSQKFGFCLTARERPIDVSSIKQAITDAKRQTPACFYIGEVRDDADWSHILKFAATGHLVIATTHASSVRETIISLLRSTDATTPALRRQCLGSTKGIVHLKKASLKGSERAIFPSLWIGNDFAINSMVSVGVSSVSPNNEFCLGREQFLSAVQNEVEQQGTFSELRKRAKKLDIQELRKL